MDGTTPHAVWRWINALAAIALVAFVTALALGTGLYGDLFRPGQYSQFKWPLPLAEAGSAAHELRSQILLHLPNTRLAIWAAVAYAAAYTIWFVAVGGGPAKPVLAILGAFKMLRHPLDPGFTPQERAALLNIAVKAVFVPLMTVWLASNLANALNAVGNTVASAGRLGFVEWYWRHLHWALFWTLLLVDTLWFWVGYLLEHPRLGNTIRSVEPTALGWLATLACYPALNIWLAQMLGWYASDQPRVLGYFGNSPTAQAAMVGLGLTVVALMAVYAWASVALGFKASNLTNRGTVTDGPYRWVRHPAYASKNAAWMVSGLVPLAATLWSVPWAGLAQAALAWDAGALFHAFATARSFLLQSGAIAFSLFAWAYIYHVRALTEERHLGMDPEYRHYCAQVRWRYIPGVH